MAVQVTSVLWKQHVEDRPVTADDFKVASSSMDPQQMGDSDILVELLYLSVDPYMRGMMRDTKSYYRQPFEPGQPLSSRGVALVKKAGPDVGSGFEEGDILSGMLPWSSHAILNRRAQVELLRQHGFDAAFNYKASSTADALKEAAPDGIDIYFDNVGGPTLDAVLEAARPHARIVACGAISQYDLPEEKRYGVKNLINVITKRIKMQGFIVGDYAAEMAHEFHENMAQHVLTGKVKALQHVTHGLENAGAAFVDIMAGGNIGKAVVQVAQQDPYPVQQQQQQPQQQQQQ